MDASTINHRLFASGGEHELSSALARIEELRKELRTAYERYDCLKRSKNTISDRALDTLVKKYNGLMFEESGMGVRVVARSIPIRFHRPHSGTIINDDCIYCTLPVYSYAMTLGSGASSITTETRSLFLDEDSVYAGTWSHPHYGGNTRVGLPMDIGHMCTGYENRLRTLVQETQDPGKFQETCGSFWEWVTHGNIGDMYDTNAYKKSTLDMRALLSNVDIHDEFRRVQAAILYHTTNYGLSAEMLHALGIGLNSDYPPVMVFNAVYALWLHSLMMEEPYFLNTIGRTGCMRNAMSCDVQLLSSYGTYHEFLHMHPYTNYRLVFFGKNMFGAPKRLKAELRAKYSDRCLRWASDIAD